MKNYLIICLCLFSCNPPNFLISSTYQHWVGGLKESGSGTNYSFKLVAPSEHSTFQVTDVYAHNYKLHFSILPTTYQRGDTLLISGIKSEENWTSKDLQAKIEYNLLNQSYSIPIKELRELDKLYYP